MFRSPIKSRGATIRAGATIRGNTVVVILVAYECVLQSVRKRVQGSNSSGKFCRINKMHSSVPQTIGAALLTYGLSREMMS